ncbi:unnamed protein product, partial [marine sediment metagenome]
GCQISLFRAALASAPYTLAHGYRFRRPLKLAKQRNPELGRPGVDFDSVCLFANQPYQDYKLRTGGCQVAAGPFLL